MGGNFCSLCLYFQPNPSLASIPLCIHTDCAHDPGINFRPLNSLIMKYWKLAGPDKTDSHSIRVWDQVKKKHDMSILTASLNPLWWWAQANVPKKMLRCANTYAPACNCPSHDDSISLSVTQHCHQTTWPQTAIQSDLEGSKGVQLCRAINPSHGSLCEEQRDHFIFTRHKSNVPQIRHIWRCSEYSSFMGCLVETRLILPCSPPQYEALEQVWRPVWLVTLGQGEPDVQRVQLFWFKLDKWWN